MQTTIVRPKVRLDLEAARRRSDELFASVRSESLFERPVPERHRLNFYLGHLEAFDWNMICDYGLSMPAFDEEFNRLYAFGIDPDMADLPTDRPGDWPSLDRTRAYCGNVRRTIDAVIAEVPEDMARTCIEHRLMHAETLCYLLHNLDYEHKRGPGAVVSKGAPSPPRQWIDIPAGSAVLGRPRGSGFGWDNEFEQWTVAAPSFQISKYKVTNGEYLEFVEQGGETPHYWKRSGGEWRLRAMFGEIPLPLDWPVYATHAQAAAYAAHVSAALPTEAQFDRAGYGSRDGLPRAYPWGDAEPDATRGNFNFQSWDPAPVTAYAGGDSAFGVSQLLGNGWEWTDDVLRPLPGFQPYSFYPGYSADSFDDDHFVLKGGGPRTAAGLLRRSFRNWFRGDYKYAHAAIRLVEN